MLDGPGNALSAAWASPTRLLPTFDELAMLPDSEALSPEAALAELVELPAPEQPLPDDATIRWLAAAPPRARRLYHVGHLARDREHNRELHLAAQLLMRAAAAGLVNLWQQRRGLGCFAYYASRTKAIWPGLAALGE